MKLNPLRVLIIVTIFIIVIAVSCGVFIYYDINERKEITIDVYKNRESLINKENTLIKIKSNYNSTVKTIRDSKLYIKNNGKYKESGKINKGNTLELESLNNVSLDNKYFKILNSNYYISYKDIKPSNDTINKRYLNYIEFPIEVTTKDNISYYDDNFKEIFMLKDL